MYEEETLAQVLLSSGPEDTVLERANAQISPYFKTANGALKETFATPSVDALSAMLVLANCHQVSSPLLTAAPDECVGCS